MSYILLSQRLVLAKFVILLVPIKGEWIGFVGGYGLWMKTPYLMNPLFETLKLLSAWSYIFLFFVTFFFFSLFFNRSISSSCMRT